MTFGRFIIYLGYFSLFINLFLYAKSYRKQSRAFSIITSYLLITFVLQMTTDYYANQKKNNLFLSHYYFIGQFLLLSKFYYQILKKGIHLKIIRFFSIIILLTLSVLFYLYPETYWTFSLFEIVICSLPIVLYALFYFYESFGVKKKKFLLFNAGIFFYLLSSTLIFTTGNYLASTQSKSSYFLYNLNAFLYVIFQIFIFSEWYVNFKKTKANYTEDEIDDYFF